MMVRPALQVLFPWRKTFKRLALEKQWWHRLAVVLFFIAIVLTFAWTWIVGFSALEPNPASMQDPQYWGFGTDGEWHVLSLGPPMTQSQYDEAAKEFKKYGGTPAVPVGARPVTVNDGAPLDGKTPIKAKVLMPDLTTREFSNPTDAEIASAWHKALRKAIFKEWSLSFGAAVLITFGLSYLIQSLYRALLYIIYGSNEGPSPTPTSDPA